MTLNALLWGWLRLTLELFIKAHFVKIFSFWYHFSVSLNVIKRPFFNRDVVMLPFCVLLGLLCNMHWYCFIVIELFWYKRNVSVSRWNSEITISVRFLWYGMSLTCETHYFLWDFLLALMRLTHFHLNHPLLYFFKSFVTHSLVVFRVSQGVHKWINTGYVNHTNDNVTFFIL